MYHLMLRLILDDLFLKLLTVFSIITCFRDQCLTFCLAIMIHLKAHILFCLNVFCMVEYTSVTFRLHPLRSVLKTFKCFCFLWHSHYLINYFFTLYVTSHPYLDQCSPLVAVYLWSYILFFYLTICVKLNVVYIFYSKHLIIHWRRSLSHAPSQCATLISFHFGPRCFSSYFINCWWNSSCSRTHCEHPQLPFTECFLLTFLYSQCSTSF